MLEPDDEAGQIAANRAAYAVIADAYAGKWGNTPQWMEAEMARLRGLLAPGSRVADIGCGPGHHTQALRGLGLNATGFDLSAEMLASVGTPGVVQANMLALPVADAAFDAVWCSAALLHIPRPSVPAALAEFARVLRPGGEMSLAVAEGDGEAWERVPYDLPGVEDVRRYYVLHRLEPLSELLEAAGFAVRDDHSRCATQRNWLHIHARRR
ncbi:MAG: class I SAM-dependent methyltransferase [Actinocrinis sp.]